MTPHFDVVLLGGDIGIYGLARAFHEEYAVTSTVVSRVIAGPVAHSRILENRPVGAEGTEADLLAELIRVGKEKKATKPDLPILVLPNADWLVKLLNDNRSLLEKWYILPTLTAEVMEQVSDKAEFAKLCATASIPTPRTLTIDFRPEHRGSDGTPVIPEIPFEFPIVAKTASSAAYAHLHFEGKRKVYSLKALSELEELVRTLDNAGFNDRFVVQEMIPGDDTCMRSVTAYVDSTGEVTLLGGAQVLLEEHTPGALGNPCAMVTADLGDLFDHAVSFLSTSGYRGFANFDIKVDPRDGTGKFFEVNPRIGRNNYYMTAAGANVAKAIVTDTVDHARLPRLEADSGILYSVVPRPLLMRYIIDPVLKSRVRQIPRSRRTNPLASPVEGSRRRAYVALALLNQVKKFAQHYPRPSANGF
ncbi:carboxylate--amine ligase [Dermabacter sp. p3-SID358]|uniref:carboxylate--amine ligase n=1 Tax=Dermabacter sp. p3-SID358 TaxID=2916114 RepID=UPI0021A3AC84|nr:carboxylate--amine ligase [Dermabacter sp. p3-SID358]MCT1867365.1 carboxylate--amine ligase [Dermabacter sp. p3-SID358]